VSACVAQEELEGVGRRLGQERERRRRVRVVDQLDPLLLELAADGIKLERLEFERLELELIDDLCDRTLPERARLLGRLEQPLPLLARQGMGRRRCFEADAVVRNRELLSLDRKSVATSRGAGDFQLAGFGVRYDCSSWPAVSLTAPLPSNPALGTRSLHFASDSSAEWA
jgi:hypothetical protein